jgi:integrase
MPIYKHKKSGVWYINIRHAGQRIFRSARTKDKDSAQRYHDQIKIDLWEQERLAKKPKRSWQEAVIRWTREMSHKKSLRDDKLHLKWLDPYLATYMLDKISRDVIENIAIEKEKTGVSPATVNRVLAVVRAILVKAEREWEWIEKAPAVRMRKEPKGRTRWLTTEQLQNLLTALPSHLKPICYFSVVTGRRRAEVLGLKWENVDMERRHAWVSADSTKSGRAGSIPLNDMAMSILKELLGKHPEYVFTYRGERIKECSTKAWRNALKAAGIENFRWHDLRHTYASWHVQNGTSLQELQQLGGWRSFNMVLRYAHLSSENLRDAANNIGAKK